MELAIDTSTEVAGIALSSQGEIIAELTWHAGQSHTTELVPNLTCILEQTKLNLKDINGVIVAKGPWQLQRVESGDELCQRACPLSEYPHSGHQHP